MTEVHEVMFTLYIRLPSHTLTYSHPHTLTPSHPHRATGGELFRVIAIDPLPEDRAREVVFQILEGVQHLHTLNIVHLDLKVHTHTPMPTHALTDVLGLCFL